MGSRTHFIKRMASYAKMSTPVVKIGSKGSSLIGQTCSARGCDKIVSSFLGIPYAEAPVGERRFREPHALELWSGQRQADQFGPACPQDMNRVRKTYGRIPNLPTVYSEDCLYLNVWTPNHKPTARRPVMVWFHGGAFVQGFSNIYDGTALAAYEDVIVVSINYRVGVFGFLRTGDGPLDYHGNQGLLDQLEALRWVQKHISCFGGDPNNVTIFGESAGGMSNSFHQVSPQASGLFRRMICQSGSALHGNSVWSAAGASKFFTRRLNVMGFQGIDSKSLVEFLDDKSTETMLEVFNDWFVPTVLDGQYLTEQPLTSYQNGRFYGVDCIIGFNSSEGPGFVPTELEDRAAAEQALAGLVAKNFFRGFPKMFTDKVTALAQVEYLRSDNYVRDVSEFYGDINFVAPSIQQAHYQSGKARTYIYQFDHRPFYSQHPDWVSADHGNEIPYMFGYPFLTYIPDLWTDEDKQLSLQLMSYWANFATTGNPNGIDSEESLWHQYTPGSRKYLKIQGTKSECHNVDELWPSRVKLWNHTVPQLLEQYSITKAKY